MNIDKKYCMSSYLAFRYIDRDDKDFFEGMHHKNIEVMPASRKIPVATADAIGAAIDAQLAPLRGVAKIGVMLSGGMDSAIVASYVPGAEAYTFRFLGGDFQKEELARAEYYANFYGLNLHYVDISWDTVERHVDAVMAAKCAPVHSIEPQILQAALQAKADGVEIYNLSSGIGTSLEEIINCINTHFPTPLKVNHVQSDATSSIKRIVLNVEKIKDKIGWEPLYDIQQGIAETINRKRHSSELE